MRIALFFTEGMSLKGWHSAGLVKRDSLLYERLCSLGHEVYFVTYGGVDDADYLPADSLIKVLTRPVGMGLRDYSWKLHRVHHDVLKSVDVLKSHQVMGARYVAYAKWRLGKKPFIARCGYLPSYFYSQEGAARNVRIRNWVEEFIAFHAADVVCVPSQSEIDYLHQRYRISTAKTAICPNWVDTDFFQPNPSMEKNIEKNPRRICFVGRFHPQKDPLVLIEALRGIPDVELLMIGGGVMKAEIESRIAEYKIQATLLDRVNNEDLPRYYNSAVMYVLPTRYEGGSPKTLFEAMACGLPVISTNGFGVDAAFSDGVHGFKVKVGDVGAIREGIRYLLDHPAEAEQFGAAARQHVIDTYSVERAMEREIGVLERV
jgi:glycosyltransferase involved in cell wall biosynthesis